MPGFNLSYSAARTDHSKRKAIAVAALLAASATPAAHAINWSGASSTNWATGANWVGNAVPGTNDSATFTDTGATNLPGEVTSLLDVNRQITSLSFNNISTKFHTLDLGTHTLTLTGNLSFNVDQSQSTTTTIRNGALVISGGFSNLNVARSVAGTASGTADLSGLTSLTAGLQEVHVGAATGNAAGGTLKLPGLTSITAQKFLVGVGTNGTSSSSGNLFMGQSTTIVAGQMVIGQDFANATAQTVNGGTVNLGSLAQGTSLRIGVGNMATNNNYSGRMDLTGANVTAYLSELIVGQKDGGSGPGGPGQMTGNLIGGNAGAVHLGSAAARGMWYTGYTINGGSSLGTSDLRGMASMDAYVSDMYVGYALSGSATGNVFLPATAIIDASNSITVGSGPGGNTSSMTLGMNTTLLANQLVIGRDFATATVLGKPGSTVTLGGANAPMSLLIGSSTKASNDNYTGRLDLTGANVTATIGQFIVGQKDGGSGPGGPGAAIGNVVGGNAGSITVGSAAARAAWYVGYTINGGNGSGTVDLRNMNSLQAYVNDFYIGKALSGSASGIVALPVSSTIDATNIVVGAGVGSGSSSLTLGMTNTILANQLIIGQDYSNGTVNIPSGGSLTLGSPAQRTSVSIALGNTSTNNTYTGILDLTNATLTAYLDNVQIGNKNPQNGAMQGTMTISNLPGNYVEANTVTLGGNQSTGTLNFGGGTLYAGTIQKGTGTANFNWTGGTLSVGSFGAPATLFNLANSGTGKLAPGTPANAVGATNVYGTYTQGSAATLAIDIAGVAPGTGNDLLAVSGAATLAGTLALNITSGYVPAVGQNLVIATYVSRSGTFGFVAPPHMPQDVAFQMDYTSSPTQLLVHMVSPTNQNFVGASASNTFGATAAWDTATAPTTTSNLAIVNNGASAKTVSVLSSTTVHRVSLGAPATAAVTLEVPQGVSLGVANQLVVNQNGTLSGGGQVLGDVVLNGGVLASFGTVAGKVLAPTSPSTIAPSATVGPTGHGTLTTTSLATNANTGLKFNLIAPGPAGSADQIVVTGPNGLTLDGGALQITASPSGAGSLGFYKVIGYTGTIQGAGITSVTMPAASNGVAYTLDAAHDAGFIDVHRGFLGDANDDGVVTFSDFVQLSNNFNQPNQGWAGADFNGDGTTNFSDFVLLSNQFGQTISGGSITVSSQEIAALKAFGAAAAVPEPLTAGSLGLGLYTLLLRRKRQ